MLAIKNLIKKERSEHEKNKKRLLEGSPGPALLNLAVPMMVGIVAIMLFSVADTFFVGQLGSDELAAMGYIFPVVFILNALLFGLGTGAISVISYAVGEGNHHKVQMLTTHALILAIAIVLILSALGIASIRIIFPLLGAQGHILDLIEQYTTIWYLGMFLLAVPIMANNAIRATGDTKTPAAIMSFAAIANIALDPLFIFGFGPIPMLGLQGAAIASVLARVITVIATLSILKFREDMLALSIPKAGELFSSWKKILHVGLPAAATNVLFPLSLGILTSFVASYGDDAVAAFGVGGRIESLALIGIMGMAASIPAFVGQNYGAKKFSRIKKGIEFAFKYSLLWGFGAYVLLYMLSSPIASLFSDDAQVISRTALYLSIIPFSYGFSGMAVYLAQTFNALRRPLWASAIIFLRLAVLAVPLAWAGSEIFGLAGIFYAIAAANVIIGIVAYFYSKKLFSDLV